MHRAFLVDEIFRQICHSFTYLDFLLLAQVCRALKELSLDILWAERALTLEQAFQPLVAWGLVDDLHTYQDDESSQIFFTEAYFNLYKPYAHRVRTVLYKEVDQSIPFRIMESLANITQEPIFPQLQRLFCTSDSVQRLETKYTNFLITPSLRTFHMHSSVCDVGALEQVANVCTSLEILRISHSHVLVNQSDRKRYHGAMNRLLITNPNLEELHITTREKYGVGPSFNFDPISLPKLKQLRIVIAGITSPFLEFGSFLRNNNLPQLKSVYIMACWAVDGKTLLEYLDGLRISGCTKIKELEFVILEFKYLERYSTLPIYMPHLRPLTVSLVDIESFTFRGPYHSSLTNEHLLLLASCNPRLRVFKIGSLPSCRMPFVENPSSDLGGIIRFARVATQLVDLQLSTHLYPIDIEPVDNLESTPNLLNWRIDGSLVQDPDNVTLTIRTHFPKLKTLTSDCNHPQSPWNEPFLELLAQFLPLRVD